MRLVINLFRPITAFLVFFTLLCGVAYPLLCTFILENAVPVQAKGSALQNKEGKVIGSSLVGQRFTQPRYFWGRPSVSDYDAAASGGSNMGAYSTALEHAVASRIAALKSADPANTQPVPVDLVTASASGLDAHISIAAARWQLSRVAKARKLQEPAVAALIEQFTEARQLGMLGEPRVNVLLLNQALDDRL